MSRNKSMINRAINVNCFHSTTATTMSNIKRIDNCVTSCSLSIVIKSFPNYNYNNSHLIKLLLLCTLITILTRATIVVNAAAMNHGNVKQFRNIAALYAWNNFTDVAASSSSALSSTDDIGRGASIDLSSSTRNDNEALKQMTAESSVVVPDIPKPNTGCPATTSSHCLRCNHKGCIKCPMYLMTDTRQCVEHCPSGYIDQWSAHTEFMGRVCTPTSYSGPLMAALAGLIGGFIVCFTLLAVAVIVVRRKRRRKSIKVKLINENTMDRSDFLRQLNEMRPNAEYFLAMLNDTRRQIRKLYLSGEIAAANSYRPIVRDLAKILILLNRPIELIPSPPNDWNRLYAWSEQALERYKPQFGQLIDFFQTTNADDFDASVYQHTTQLYRQQSQTNLVLNDHGGVGGGGGGGGGSGGTMKSQQKLHMFGSLISLHEFEEPRPSDPFGSSFNTLKRGVGGGGNGNLISDLNASSLWLEDEFYKLGFRPQDEITTEL